MQKILYITTLLIVSLIGCFGFASCSDDDFSDKKEMIKGIWRTEGNDGWMTIEFNGNDWNGTYLERGSHKWKYYSGKYKWENDLFVQLRGTEANGEEFSLTLTYVFGCDQMLVFQGAPGNPFQTTRFYKRP